MNEVFIDVLEIVVGTALIFFRKQFVNSSNKFQDVVFGIKANYRYANVGYWIVLAFGVGVIILGMYDTLHAFELI
jgi:hypothetical protein